MVSLKNRVCLKSTLKKTVEFWNKLLWTDEMSINLYQTDGKCEERKEKAPHLIFQMCNGLVSFS